MKLALLSDIHANLHALQAVISDLEQSGAEAVLFLGDAVGYGAFPNEVAELVAKHCEVRILGNHDAGAVGLIDSFLFNDYARNALVFTEKALSDESRASLRNARISYELDEMLLVHATPEEPEEWRYCLTINQAKRQFEHFDNSICFIGHSHWPVVFSLGQDNNVRVEPPGRHVLVEECRYLINVGSVGQPRDGNPQSCYVIFDNDTRQLEFRRVDYDIVAAQQAMADHNLPEFLIQRIAGGR